MQWIQTDIDQWVVEISEDIYRVLTIVHLVEEEQEKYALKDAVVNLSKWEEGDFHRVARKARTYLGFIKEKRGENWERHIAELYVRQSSPYTLFVKHEKYPFLLHYIKEKYQLENDYDAVYE